MIAIPYLVLASKADRFTNYKCSERLAEKYNATLRLHEKAGHDLPLDDPQWIIDRVKESFYV